MVDATRVLDLAGRVEAASGPDRNLDAEIAEQVYGWRRHRIPADANGAHSCDVLTPDGEAFRFDGRAWVYPSLGAVHIAYHCPAWTRDCRDEAFPRSAIRQHTAAMLRARAAEELANG